MTNQEIANNILSLVQQHLQREVLVVEETLSDEMKLRRFAHSLRPFISNLRNGRVFIHPYSALIPPDEDDTCTNCP